MPSTGYYKYQRVYNPYTAVLFSQIVGFDSIIYGKTGIEAEYNSYLQSHTRPAKTLGDLLTNRTTTGNVTLTISYELQSQVAQAVDATDVDGSAPQAGAVVINVKTGAIEAMYGNPTFDPRPLVSPEHHRGEVRLDGRSTRTAPRARWCRGRSSTDSCPARPSRRSPRPPSTTTSPPWPS